MDLSMLFAFIIELIGFLVNLFVVAGIALLALLMALVAAAPSPDFLEFSFCRSLVVVFSLSLISLLIEFQPPFFNSLAFHVF